jgi:hypothetical protein
MKKFINRPDKFVDEMLEGILAAHPDQLRTAANDLRCIVTARPKPRATFRSSWATSETVSWTGAPSAACSSRPAPIRCSR